MLCDAPKVPGDPGLPWGEALAGQFKLRESLESQVSGSPRLHGAVDRALERVSCIRVKLRKCLCFAMPPNFPETQVCPGCRLYPSDDAAEDARVEGVRCSHTKQREDT